MGEKTSELQTFLNASAERNQAITVASVLFLLFGLGSAVADPPLLAYVAYYHRAPVLPLIGNVLDDTAPIGVFGVVYKLTEPHAGKEVG